MNEDILSLLSAEGEQTESGSNTEGGAETENGTETGTENNTETGTTVPVEEPSASTSGSNGILTSLGIMGKGMLGIFIVTAVIIVTIVILNKLTSPKKPERKNSSEEG